MNPDHPEVQAIAISSERITAVGTSEEIAALAGSTTQVIEIQGHVLMPGFVDAHSHVWDTTERNEQVFLETHEWLLSMGITAIGEAGARAELVDWMKTLRDSDRIRMRVAMYS